MLSVIYTECHIQAYFTTCHYAECHYAEYHLCLMSHTSLFCHVSLCWMSLCWVSFMLNVTYKPILPRIIMLNVVMLSVVLPSIVAILAFGELPQALLRGRGAGALFTTIHFLPNLMGPISYRVCPWQAFSSLMWCNTPTYRAHLKVRMKMKCCEYCSCTCPCLYITNP